MSDTVQQIKSKLSIQEVVGQYVKLTRVGGALKARCPFHSERTPSFHISPDRGTYHCFGCGVGGDMFSFVQAIEGIDFKGALKILAERAGVPLVYSRTEKTEHDEKDRLFELMEAATLWYQSRMTEEARGYLRERGLSDETIKIFRIGWAGNGWTDAIDFLKSKRFSEKEMAAAGLSREGDRGAADKFRNRIMFPLFDTAGRVVAFSGRTFGKDAHPDAPKYLNSPETILYHKSSLLYGFDKAKQAMRQLNCAILVEGQMDLVMSHQAGWANTVAVSGTAFTTEHAMLIKRMTDNLILALDADEAGLKAASKAAKAALQKGMRVKVAHIPGEKDPADLILKEGPDVWKGVIKHAKDIITFLLDVLHERIPQSDKYRRMVEVAVVPFLHDVQSPIDKDAYVREIAGRIGVSDEAVREALTQVPRVPTDDEREKPAAVMGVQKQVSVDQRAFNAYGLLLWQRSVAKPAIDTVVFEKHLSDAAGKQTFETLRALPEVEQERCRFLGEQRYGEHKGLQKELTQLLALIERSRLEKELRDLGEVLKAAERAGIEAEEARVQQEIQVLTSRIAQLHTKV
ncbi:DNA primase [bacterium]|nr:DNA primase [bacterium]